VTSGVRYASDSGGLYQFVKPELVVTVHLTDLQSERSDGTVTTAPLLSYSGSSWAAHGVRPCPRPIHAVLDRVRDDKQPTAAEAGFTQVSGWLAPTAGDAKAGSLAASKVLRREVWTKETKGQLAVRKLLIWKTNKEATEPSYPAFVVHWTDYSAGRATPLDREVRLAPTEALAMKLGDEMVAANIKKGWNKT
jgi:hypothetical protein